MMQEMMYMAFNNDHVTITNSNSSPPTTPNIPPIIPNIPPNNEIWVYLTCQQNFHHQCFNNNHLHNKVDAISFKLDAVGVMGVDIGAGGASIRTQ